MNRIQLRVRVATVFILGCVPAVRADQPRATLELCGRLTVSQGIPVLEVWGSPEQTGFAHGYFMAEPIISTFDDFVLNPDVCLSPAVYQAVTLPAVRRQFEWTAGQEQELGGILDGMRARLGAGRVRSDKLSRELSVEDLMVANTVADWKGLMCSSFSAWGDMTTDGQTISARNLDYPSTPAMAKSQFLFIYRGDASRRAWAGVTWPGLIGAYTAISNDGVTVMMHDARGLPASQAENFTPRSLALREALESAAPERLVDDVRKVLERRRFMSGGNIHCSAPSNAASPAAAVFESDANERDHGVTTRVPEPGDSAVSKTLLCTNHYCARSAPRPCARYARLGADLAALAASGRKLDAQTAMQLIGNVRERSTLHSVCFTPDRLSMFVNIPAISNDTVEFNLRDWFARPKSTAAPTSARP